MGLSHTGDASLKCKWVCSPREKPSRLWAGGHTSKPVSLGKKKNCAREESGDMGKGPCFCFLALCLTQCFTELWEPLNCLYCCPIYWTSLIPVWSLSVILQEALAGTASRPQEALCKSMVHIVSLWCTAPEENKPAISTGRFACPLACSPDLTFWIP